MCSGNYSNVKRALRNVLYLSEHKLTRYIEKYPIEMKRPKTDITYKDAKAVGPSSAEYSILWTLPAIISSIHFSPNDKVAFDLQMTSYLYDCIIWAYIIHSNCKGLLAGKPTENLLCWLFFKYVCLYCRRNDTGSWTTGATYNQILDVLLPKAHNLANLTFLYDQRIQQRNLVNFRSKYKKSDGEIYVFKSIANYSTNKHSNSATCFAKYTKEEIDIIGDEKIGRNEAARRLNALGYKICPSTVTNVRKRLRTAKEQTYKRRPEKDEVGLF